MVTREQIPEIAICHKCGEPMKVVNLHENAERLGVKLSRDSFVIECCGSALTIENDFAYEELRDLLLSYHQMQKG